MTTREGWLGIVEAGIQEHEQRIRWLRAERENLEEQLWLYVFIASLIIAIVFS